jgi:predicted transglutaminase-like cysteine proteinase
VRKYLLGFIGAACLALSASAAVADGYPMPISGSTSQPIGHYDFCQRYGSECQRNEAVGLIRLTPAAWKQIVAINKAVNASIFPRTDQEIYGRPEYWDYPTTEGDCEDFALLKQYMLEKAGYSRSALLLTVARQPNGDGHAVLTVRTDRGDFILDNLEERVLDWKSSDLRFLKRQSERNAGKWMGIDDDRDMLVGSVR